MRTFSTLLPALLVRENETATPTVYPFSPLNQPRITRLNWEKVLKFPGAQGIMTEDGTVHEFVKGFRLGAEVEFQFYDQSLSSPYPAGITEEAILDLLAKMGAGYIVEFRPHYDPANPNENNYVKAYDCLVFFEQSRSSQYIARMRATFTGKYVIPGDEIPTSRW